MRNEQHEISPCTQQQYHNYYVKKCGEATGWRGRWNKGPSFATRGPSAFGTTTKTGAGPGKMCVISFLPCHLLLTGSLVHGRAEIAVDAATMKIMQPVYEARRKAVKSLPRFWGTALAQHSQLAVYMAGQDDMRALAHLTDLWVEYDPVEPRAFTIIFVSAPT